MGLFIDPADLTPFVKIDPAKLDAMIADAESQAIEKAPCLVDPENANQANPALNSHQLALVKSILRASIIRWDEGGTGGAVQQQTAGPFSLTTDARRKGMFWPSEIEQLQRLCANSSGAFAIDTAPACWMHLPWCALSLGALYCDCGADIAGHPLYEGG